MRFIILTSFLVFLNATFSCHAQLKDRDISNGYNYYNSKSVKNSPLDVLNGVTMNPNEKNIVRDFFNKDSIIKYFEPHKTLVDNKFVELQENIDSAFSAQQLYDLDIKLNSLKSVNIDKSKLKADYRIIDSTFFMSSFPIIQKSKDSVQYAFIYEEAKNRPYGRLRIEKNIFDNWFWVGTVRIPKVDFEKFKSSIKNFPEEYQVINCFLFGKEASVRKEFSQNGSTSRDFDYLLDPEKWNRFSYPFEEQIEIRKHLSDDNIQNIVNYLNGEIEGLIDEDFLLEEISCYSEKEILKPEDAYGLYNLSKPYVFVSGVNNNKYAIFYYSKVDGRLNGGGGLILMKKINGIYEVLISEALWVS
ncbi:MAG: hypothetical protein ABGW91_00770 [Christiangramia sp.]